MSAISYHPPLTPEGIIHDAVTAWESTVFYGPHACLLCGDTIVKAAREHGGAEYDQPDEPIYPNTKWVRHNCLDSDAAPQPSVQS